jgi:hypothetical protein
VVVYRMARSSGACRLDQDTVTVTAVGLVRMS